MKRMIPWMAVVGYLILIWLVSQGPPPQAIAWDYMPNDKVLHATEYMVLGLLLGWAGINTWPGRSRCWQLGAAFVIGLLAAASDELHQYFVPERTSDIKDWMADGLGLVVGLALAELLSRGARLRADAR
ncbi:MAG: VanZ family protein [Myxococcales bacterium]|nr:VanZ family protein [Myxococcales bacterium]MCB9708164.1 VanZ family protein [Myxococcales bacterium]